jgi:predicted amidophosphoribosyltransferase
MTASPFGINVVSRSHTVVCRTCGSKATRVGETCSECGARLADAGFAIVANSYANPGMGRGRSNPQAGASAT